MGDGRGRGSVRAKIKFQNVSQYFEHIEEMEWAIEECLKTSLPVGASMCIGPEGDMHGVTAAECAVRMARAGAHIGERETVRHRQARKLLEKF